jgi:hypothetical protein
MTKAYVKATTIGNQVMGVVNAGVCLFKKDISSELDFLLLTATDVSFPRSYCSVHMN